MHVLPHAQTKTRGVGQGGNNGYSAGLTSSQSKCQRLRSVVIFEPEMGNQVFATQVTQSVLKLH